MMVKLGDICTIVSGSTPKSNIPEYWDGDIKWITPAELSEDTYIINDSVRHITELGVQKTGLKPFPKDTVILSSRAPIGKTAIAGCEMYCNQGFKNLICSERINPRYLYWFLSCNTEYLNSLGRGATFKEISKEIVSNIDIPLPPLEQQSAIAVKFEQVSKLIALRKEQLAKLDELVKARFVEMFGDYPATAKLSNVAVISGGLTKNSKRDSFPLKMPYLRVANVGYDKIDITEMLEIGLTEEEYKKTLLQYDDLLFVEGNGSPDQIGRVAVWRDEIVPCVHQNHLIKARLDKKVILPFFALHYFMTVDGREQIKSKAVSTSGLYTLSVSKIADFLVPIPPLELQEKFTFFVEQTDKTKLTLQESLGRLEVMKKALLDHFFNVGSDIQ